MIQSQETGNKPHFGPDLGPLDTNSGREIFFLPKSASSITRYYGQLSL